ncbi:lipoyl(octanoyl) transferase LipB [Demequina capsici]|uniref:Octanoyltransferase n=1 Tax=Demequina capsici TaxID=3075620 RepID=A0AA96F9R4_9MICO|nr:MULTISPECIES: lipoyl(octanoyl) transferase LipB [unclassified Demequina]WNM25957.1 lipoyl(octanoyl) transferase LipB [Demequina sp. OYTSA14]WNM28836.1 lipoyl(octanoyl) transferase LipB [Demequina sp. PMTSA13]
MWDLQRHLHDEVVAGRRTDTLVLVEHASVYTAGRRTASWDRPLDGTPVVEVDRGGKITWHGPGQLVGYPIMRLAEPVDVVRYVRCLEQAVIDACAALGVRTMRVEGRSGVWLPADGDRRERKICAIGVRVAKGVTMHGFALNCDPDLSEFDRIVPCGISDADVTSLTAELGHDVAIADVVPAVLAALERALADVRWTPAAEDAPTPGAFQPASHT